MKPELKKLVEEWSEKMEKHTEETFDKKKEIIQSKKKKPS